MSSDADQERLAHADYWDECYVRVKPGQETGNHEWYRSFDDLVPFFEENLFKRPGSGSRILHLGSGDSTVPDHLATRGYTNQLCLDFSPVVVELMTKRHAKFEGIEWKEADVRHMDAVPSSSIDVAFDKGTLDAMIHGSPWSPPQDVLDNTSQYMREVARVLKPDGVYLYVGFRQPHFIRPLLEREGMSWDIKVDVLGGAGSFGYSGFTLTKAAVQEPGSVPREPETASVCQEAVEPETVQAVPVT